MSGGLEFDSDRDVDTSGSAVEVGGCVVGASDAVSAELVAPVALAAASAAANAASCRFTSTIFSIGSLLVGVRGIYKRRDCSQCILSTTYIQ